MRNKIRIWGLTAVFGIISFFSEISFAQHRISSDSLRFIHRAGFEIRPGYIIPTHDFLRGENANREPIRRTYSAHLKYSFKFRPDSYMNCIYPGVYQGIGISYFNFANHEEIGNPVAFYLFQGARIASITSQLSFNYEWNFGLSVGWKPYEDDNYYNQVIGSKANAYLNTDFYFNWSLSPQLDLLAGVTATHFSNGNTKFPNAGLNTVAAKLGIVYNFNTTSNTFRKSVYKPTVPEFPRHISYDVVLFGSWRRKGVPTGDVVVASPDAYPVVGFNITPMYNLSYKFRVGASLDGYYDGSANIYSREPDYSSYQEFLKPPLRYQIALGLSGRAEFVMPYFTVGLGIGGNVTHKGGDLKAFYQILALKAEVTRNSFIHIGYCLQDFHMPNFLMLGIGYRFNNRFPVFHK